MFKNCESQLTKGRFNKAYTRYRLVISRHVKGRLVEEAANAMLS